MFECEISPARRIELKARLLAILDQTADSLRFHDLGTDGHRRIEHIGAKAPLDLNPDLLSVATTANLRRESPPRPNQDDELGVIPLGRSGCYHDAVASRAGAWIETGALEM